MISERWIKYVYVGITGMLNTYIYIYLYVDKWPFLFTMQNCIYRGCSSNSPQTHTFTHVKKKKKNHTNQRYHWKSPDLDFFSILCIFFFFFFFVLKSWVKHYRLNLNIKLRLFYIEFYGYNKIRIIDSLFKKVKKKKKEKYVEKNLENFFWVVLLFMKIYNTSVYNEIKFIAFILLKSSKLFTKKNWHLRFFMYVNVEEFINQQQTDV